MLLRPPSRKCQAGKIQFTYVMLLALLAISAGVGFGQWQSTRNAEPLDKLQTSLSNALVFPDDYKQLPDFDLLDQNGQSIDVSSFSDNWSMLFFGFTQCPDICPITLAVLGAAQRQIKQDHPQAQPFEIVFMSVDPKRDPPEVIKPYVEGFNSEARGITGELSDVLDFAKNMSIVVAYDADEDDPSLYTVDHTASILLVDPEQRVRAKFNVPHEAETLASDYLKIRQVL